MNQRIVAYGAGSIALTATLLLAGGVVSAYADTVQLESTSKSNQAGVSGTGSRTSNSHAVSNGWHKNGDYYSYYKNGVPQRSRWIVTRNVPSKHKKTSNLKKRYWVDSEGHLARNRFIDPNGERDAAAGYAAAASKSGAVRTAKFTYKNSILYPGTKGKLSSRVGFRKSKQRGNGAKVLRYWASVSPDHPHITGVRTGFFEANGKQYYSNTQGAVYTSGMKKIQGKYYSANRTGALSPIEKAEYRMVKKAQRQSSGTRYLIMVDTEKCRTGVFRHRKGGWKVIKYWKCTVGKRSTPTPKGTYRTYLRGYSFGHGFTCYWYTAFYGDYMLHSKTYYEGTFKVKHGKIGDHRSHGCVRLDLKNAKWIYKNIPLGTTVRTY